MHTLDALKDHLIHIGRRADARGWLMATSGNLSARLDPETFLITASGCHKGELTREDFLVCDLDGQPTHPTERRPSAETLLHAVLYAHDPTCGAVVHVHDPFAALCSDRDADLGHTTLSRVELIKALGLWTDDATIHIPILPNPAHIPTLAAHVRDHLATRAQSPPDTFHTPAVNILRHGTYAFGPTLPDAWRHTEALGYLFQYAWHRPAPTPGA